MDNEILGRESFSELLNNTRQITNQYCIQSYHDLGEKLSSLSKPEMIPELTHLMGSVNLPVPASNQSTNARNQKNFLFFGFPILENSKAIISLLQDLRKGRLNALLEEALNNAHLSISIKKKDPKDPTSRNILSLNIEVAATIIDKYAGLLEIILAKNHWNKEELQTLIDSKETLSNSAERLKHLSVSLGILKLRGFVHGYNKGHASACNCFGVWFSLRSSKRSERFIAELEELTKAPFTANELIGAVYYKRTQLNEIHNSLMRDALREGLDEIIESNHYPTYKVDSLETIQPYINAFANSLELFRSTGPIAPIRLPDLPIRNEVFF